MVKKKILKILLSHKFTIFSIALKLEVQVFDVRQTWHKSLVECLYMQFIDF